MSRMQDPALSDPTVRGKPLDNYFRAGYGAGVVASGLGPPVFFSYLSRNVPHQEEPAAGGAQQPFGLRLRPHLSFPFRVLEYFCSFTSLRSGLLSAANSGNC